MEDFNLPDLKCQNISALSRNLCDAFEAHELEQYVQTSTRGNSILDLVLYNKPKFVTDVKVGPPIGNSDRAVVSFYLKVEATYEASQWIRDFKSVEYESMKNT